MALGPEHPDDGPQGEVAHERLERAAELLRSERPADWEEVSRGVAGRLRSVVRPAHVLEATGPADLAERGSRLAVSSRVLLPALRRALDSADAVAESLDLTIEAGRLSAVDVDLVCAFGADVRVVGERVADAVVATVSDLLGADPRFDLDRVQVRVVDVVEGDPRLH